MPTIREQHIRDITIELPHSIPIFELLTRSGHYHFGYFRSLRQGLGEAMDGLALLRVGEIKTGERVLDVGCGVGGTATLLAERGHPTFGVDISRASVAYANERARSPRVRFVRRWFQQLRPTPARYGAVMMIEVTQHFAQLEAALARAACMLQPGALIFVRDLFTRHEFPRDRVPYHSCDALRRAVRASGLEFVERRDITERVLPTVPKLLERIAHRRSAIVAQLGHHRPDIEHEIDELIANVRILHQAQQAGDLVYLANVIRNPGGR